MAELNDILISLKKALTAWENVLKEGYSDIVRDATIQRYEFTFELLWKCLRAFLKEHEGISCNSPKSCFREAKKSLTLTEEEIELCLEMTDSRNLSVHTYSEKLAKALYDKTKKYFQISKKIFDQIERITL